MTVKVQINGDSRSFPQTPPTFDGDGLIIAGSAAGRAYAEMGAHQHSFVAIELGTECLAEHTGLESSSEHRRTVGFARFRLGSAEPSPLVEIVRQDWTDEAAIQTARAAFESGALVTALCRDFDGRIVDRLIRPYLNAALRRLDEGLASAADMDRTLCMGLGYPEGPIAILDRTGLAAHAAVSQALYEATADPDLAPARRARVVARREGG
jgi:3-hydroxybutyryl-CoA dehydrogenase